MKKVFTILAAVLLTASVFAQPPEKMSYQAVIRNSSNALVTNMQVGMQISILQGSTSGSSVYVETQTPTTNANGLVSVEIGNGTVVSGDFTTIDWANGTYFVKTETDPDGSTGGITYNITGTSQLLSVPYALHAKTAETVTGTITETDPTFTSSQAANITANDITKLSNLSGVNTGDQDLSGLATTTAVTTGLDGKVDKVSGQGLSTNDYTNAEKTKLAAIATGAEVNVNADWNATSGDAQILNKPAIPTAADGSETKLTSGTNVTITGSGTTASPYVVNASSAGARYLGEEYLGGIIFYLYIGNDGQQHGLVVSKTESPGDWSGSTWVGANKSSDGAFNTNLMPAGSTAKTWVTGLGVEWYLPSIDELSLLWNNRFHVNKSTASGLTLLSTTSYYWSSTEYDASYAFTFYFSLGSSASRPKNGGYSVRAIRAF